MDFIEASKLLSSGGVRYFIPSLKADLLFSNLTTGIQKQLAQTSYDRYDLYVSHITRIGLFDEMLLERTREIKSSMLTITDQVAFIAQLQRSANGQTLIKIQIICPECKNETELSINLDKVIDNCKKHEFKTMTAEYGGPGGKRYKFVLKEPSWLDIVILFNGIKQSDDLLLIGSDTAAYMTLTKLCLYIETIYIDDEELIDGNGNIFSKLTVPERLKFFDKLPPSITADEQQKNSLYNLVIKNYNDIELSRELFEGAVKPAKCGKCEAILEGDLTYDTFFLQ